MHAIDVDARIALTLAVVITCLFGCAGNPAPREWRTPAAEAQRSTRGGWIRIDAMGTSGEKSSGGMLAEGELIAIDKGAFHVLTAAGLQLVPLSAAHRITLVGYGNRAGTVTLWAVVGGISTLSHGFYLLFTAPTWATAGIIASHTEKQAGIWHDDDLARRFARFPQGLPPDFDPKTLGTLASVAGPRVR